MSIPRWADIGGRPPAGDCCSVGRGRVPTVDEFMDRLVAFFEGNEPLTADSGLL